MDDLLAQRKKEQQELIDLKKMQQGQKYVQPAANNVATTATGKSKWENFWYYNKMYIAIILVIAIVLAVGVTQCATRTRYDATVVLYCDLAVSTDTVLLLGNTMKEFCDDTNGNGSVDVNVADCSISEAERMSEAGVSKSNKLMAMFTDPSAILYIVDDYGFDKLSELNDGAYIDDSLDLPDKDGKALKISGTDFDIVFSPTFLTDYSEKTDFYIFRRVVDGTAIEKNKNVMKNYDAAAETIRKIQKKYYENN